LGLIFLADGASKALSPAAELSPVQQVEPGIYGYSAFDTRDQACQVPPFLKLQK
jgi:hypothetical protein